MANNYRMEAFAPTINLRRIAKFHTDVYSGVSDSRQRHKPHGVENTSGVVTATLNTNTTDILLAEPWFILQAFYILCNFHQLGCLRNIPATWMDHGPGQFM